MPGLVYAKHADWNDFEGVVKAVFINLQDSFGALFQNLEFPTEDDFHLFDSNEDGVLYYEEWFQSLA